MAAPLLIDVGCLCPEHTDAALEFMAKAVGEDPPGDDIWAPHPNPYVRRIVELFTQRGLDRIEGVRAELARWLRGAEYRPTSESSPARPARAMRRWGPDELGVARLYLQKLPPKEWTLDDWLMLVDFLAQRYLPETDLRTEADWLATRANIMGRVAAAAGDATPDEADRYLAELPSLPAPLAPAQAAALEYGRVRCAEAVTGFSDTLRHKLRRFVVDYQEAVFLGDRAATSESLQTKLLDEFGMANRDWRRIAVTEATENVNQGMVAAAGAGAKLRRVEKYRGACPFCRQIDGAVLTVVDPAKPDKNGSTEVWTGKTNIGRSASPRRRSGGALIEREPHEMWWVAAGAQHPHCRGSWVRVGGASEDPEFEEWLKQLKRGRS